MPRTRNPLSSGIRKKKSQSKKKSSSRRTMDVEDRNLVTTVVRPRGGLSSPTFSFTRWADVSSIYNTQDGSAGGTIVNAINNDTIFQGFISLGNLPGFADFQNLFSQFKITKLEYHFINNIFTDVVGPTNAGAVNTTAPKNVAVYVGSQNDLLGTASITQIQQESGVIVRDFCNMGRPLIVKIAKPTYKGTSIDTTGAVVAGSTDLNGWLDTQSGATTPYRGFYMGIQSSFQATGQATTVMPLYSARVKINLIFRGVR